MHHIKGHLGLDLPPRSLRQRLLVDGLNVIPVDDEIAIRSVELELEGFHADPADRIIAATAIIGGHQLATADHKITFWAQHSQLLATFNPTNQ